ncbi:MAG: DNA replication/repair protein RecF [Thermoanaerobaculia bacterium]
MRFSEITPLRFRNLSPDPVFFGHGLHVLAGENGQGKTNLLEAVALLCGQRSFRRALPSSCAPDGERFAVSGELCRQGPGERLSVEWSRAGGRRFLRGEKAAAFREISELAPAVFLAPEHWELLAGPPQARRRFLDRLVLARKPAAGDDLARYGRALAERNALLAPGRGRAPGAEELETWTEELVLAGAAVRRERAEALLEWGRFFEPLAREAGPEYAGIRADYPAGAETEESLRASCGRMLPAERRRGHSLCGPHRDDLIWTRGGRPLAAEASSGEVHRVVALAKLAEWHAVSLARAEAPLFAADDFDAGLSRAGIEALLSELPTGAQVLLTTASDPARWKGRATLIWMRAGRALAPAPAAALSASGA